MLDTSNSCKLSFTCKQHDILQTQGWVLAVAIMVPPTELPSVIPVYNTEHRTMKIVENVFRLSHAPCISKTSFRRRIYALEPLQKANCVFPIQRPKLLHQQLRPRSLGCSIIPLSLYSFKILLNLFLSCICMEYLTLEVIVPTVNQSIQSGGTHLYSFLMTSCAFDSTTQLTETPVGMVAPRNGENRS